MKFEIIKSNNPKHVTKSAYRWRLLADDGRLIARSRKYKTLKKCQNDIHYVALSAVSISLDHLLSPDAFSFADLVSFPDSSSTNNQPTPPADFLSAATPVSIPAGVF